ncbi:hypothetical protein HMSSN036_29710 [Paenibacillus macerans]|nr:hypothetical protein HMSSN036_29710 [Paenibacillus macerans]
MNLRAEQITPEVVTCMKKLKKVGLGKVFIGLESFNEFDLKLYGKIFEYQIKHKCNQYTSEY